MSKVSHLAPYSISDPFSFEALQRYAGLRTVQVDEATTDQLEADTERAAIECDAAHLDFEAQLDARRALTVLGDRLGRNSWEAVVTSAAEQLGYSVSFD